jgi:hypothetical protein
MTITVTDGSQTATLTTEHTLFDSSAAGTYLLSVDLVNMAAGDVTELRVYEMVRTSGTRRVAYLARFTDAQPTDGLVAISVPITTGITDSGAVRFTLKQTLGTGRAYPWSVKQVA